MSDKTKSERPSGITLMREPFPKNQISKLPKPTKRQTEEVRADFKKGVRCKVCGMWHHPDVVHLDYVGHAALTDRLLDCDVMWNWEPVAKNEDGTPAFDANGGMWIKLTVCGVTRLGYGHPDEKKGGDAIKEVIGDALRNAAMRFGAALDLWHKGDLHGGEPETSNEDEKHDEIADNDPEKEEQKRDPRKVADAMLSNISKAASDKDLNGMKKDSTKFADAWEWLEENHKPMFLEVKTAFLKRLNSLTNSDLGGDDLPY